MQRVLLVFSGINTDSIANPSSNLNKNFSVLSVDFSLFMSFNLVIEKLLVKNSLICLERLLIKLKSKPFSYKSIQKLAGQYN